MKTALLIPLYEQRQYWPRMLSAIEAMSILPDIVYVLMDRPSISDYNYVQEKCSEPTLKTVYKVLKLSDIPEFVGRPNHLPEQDLFLTGYRRNQGIDMAIADGCDVFVFIDGDCIPQVDLIKAHLEANSKGVPNISVGRRREEKHNWKDQREVDIKVKAIGLFARTNHRVITEKYLLHSSTIIWTCNCSMNLQAVNRIKKLNARYYDRNEVFSSEFLGTWGGEDGFLGIEAVAANVFITMINDDKSGIRHIDHERPIQKYSAEAFSIYLAAQIDLLNMMVGNNPLPIDFYLD